MTVKEIFDLRKQGRIEEAYDAIRPMYAANKGRYTSLCMFWTAADVFKLRLEQQRIDEATKILEALKRMLPRVEEINKELDAQRQTAPANTDTRSDEAKLPWDNNDRLSNGNAAARFIDYAERRLIAMHPCSTQSEDFSNKFSSDFEAQKPTNEKENPINQVNPCSVDLNSAQQAVLTAIRQNPGLRVPKLSELTNSPSKSIERHISVLIDRALIEHRGSKKTGGYYAK